MLVLLELIVYIIIYIILERQVCFFLWVKRKKAIFSTQDIEQILGILYDTTGHDMSFEKQEDGTLSVTIDGTVYSVDTVQ